MVWEDDAALKEEARENASVAGTTPGVAPSDAVLAAAAQAGDTAAFGTLVERYAQRLFQYLYRMVGQREEAEDLTQESFLKAYRCLHQFDATREFRSWMYAIATNSARNALRSPHHRRSVALDAVDGRVEHAATAYPGKEMLFSRLRREEMQERLARALSRLPEQGAALIDLHYREGMSLREAGAVLGMSEGAAKVALHRARRGLRELMTKEDFT